MIGAMRRGKTFAEILAQAKSEPKAERVVRPGGLNAAGEFFDLAGNLLTRLGEISPEQAQQLVADGALLAFEGCGCGGSAGCKAEWVDASVRGGLARTSPRFVKGYGAPTWIDVWQGEDGYVVYAHGDVEWGDALA